MKKSPKRNEVKVQGNCLNPNLDTHISMTRIMTQNPTKTAVASRETRINSANIFLMIEDTTQKHVAVKHKMFVF